MVRIPKCKARGSSVLLGCRPSPPGPSDGWLHTQPQPQFPHLSETLRGYHEDSRFTKEVVSTAGTQGSYPPPPTPQETFWYLQRSQGQSQDWGPSPVVIPPLPHPPCMSTVIGPRTAPTKS